MAVGIIGGAVRIHPIAKICMKILGVKSSNEFGEVLAAVGLAQNLAALRALSSEGIQRGHMALHARNIALAAGAPTELVETIAERMAKEKTININRAQEILTELTNLNTKF
jgi:hydroxymethylglutaryl-CoA reductase